MRTPYDPVLTELLRCLPGARWNADLKRWTVPLHVTEALRTALPQLTELAADAVSRAGGQSPPGPPCTFTTDTVIGVTMPVYSR